MVNNQSNHPCRTKSTIYVNSLGTCRLRRLSSSLCPRLQSLDAGLWQSLFVVTKLRGWMSSAVLHQIIVRTLHAAARGTSCVQGWEQENRDKRERNTNNSVQCKWYSAKRNWWQRCNRNFVSILFFLFLKRKKRQAAGWPTVLLFQWQTLIFRRSREQTHRLTGCFPPLRMMLSGGDGDLVRVRGTVWARVPVLHPMAVFLTAKDMWVRTFCGTRI